MGLPFMGFVLLAVKDNILGCNIYACLADNIRRRQVRRISPAAIVTPPSEEPMVVPICVLNSPS